jgi:hypothetical protein
MNMIVHKFDVNLIPINHVDLMENRLKRWFRIKFFR